MIRINKDRPVQLLSLVSKVVLCHTPMEVKFSILIFIKPCYSYTDEHLKK